MRRGGLLALIALVALIPAAPVGAAQPPAVQRVLVISVPHLTWSDLGNGVSPHLDALIDKSAVGNLSVRAARRRTTLGDGYATIGAGTRSGAPRGIDGIALAPDEPFEGGMAGEAYERRFGRVLRGAVGVLSAPSYETVNDDLLYGAEVGALGEALADAGVTAAVVGNADPSRTSGDYITYSRQAAAALMTEDGRLPAGRVDRGLLRPDPEAPFGHRLDPAETLAAFDNAWRGRSVVLVEASDLARAEAYAEVAAPGARTRLLNTALGWTDALVERMLRRVDPKRHAVMVVAPAAPRRETRLTVMALRAPGRDPGLLRSASTRRSGFVVIADVGPTVLDLLDVSRPSSMEGRPMEPGRNGGGPDSRRDFLIDADRDARFRDSLVGPVALGWVVGQVVLSALAVVVLRQEHRGRGRLAIEVGALMLLAFLPFTYLAALLPFSRLGTPAYLAFVLAGALGLAVGARALDRGRPRRDLLPLAAVLGVVLAVIVGSTVTGSRLSLSTVFGDSPIVAWRFSGIGNLTFAQLATAAVLLAGFLGHRLGGRKGAWAGIALLVGVLVVDGLPAWGADVGGVLSAVPAFALVGGLLLGIRVGRRVVVSALGGTVVALTGFMLFDLSRSSSDRSHLGRLFEQTEGGGWDALAQVVERKLHNNLSVLTSSVWTLMVPAALAFVAYLVYRSPSALGMIQRRVPELRMALFGILVVGVLAFALNDSGIAIPGMMLGVLNPVLVYLSARWA